MQLNELFSQQPNVTVWKRIGGNLSVERGLDGFGLRSTNMVNRLRFRKETTGEEEQA